DDREYAVQIVRGVAGRNEDRVRSAHRVDEAMVERVAADVAREVDGHARDLLHARVLRVRRLVTNADLGEADAPHTAVARPLAEVRLVDRDVERLHGTTWERQGLPGVRAGLVAEIRGHLVSVAEAH